MRVRNCAEVAPTRATGLVDAFLGVEEELLALMAASVPSAAQPNLTKSPPLHSVWHRMAPPWSTVSNSSSMAPASSDSRVGVKGACPFILDCAPRIGMIDIASPSDDAVRPDEQR